MGDAWEGAAKLLSAGPLGLGAIVVLVTGFILMTGRAIEQGRLKVSLSMLAAGCILVLAGLAVLFVQTQAARADAAAEVARSEAAKTKAFVDAKAAASHNVFFRIEPLHLIAASKLPPAVISVNGEELKGRSYTVESDVTVIVDVSAALGVGSQSEPKASTSPPEIKLNPQQMTQLIADLETSISQVQRIPQLMNQSCPGGAHGINPFNYDSVVSLSNSLTASLSVTKELLSVSKP
jgi:hypothetical protein